ncbi:hypothetical protein O9993_05645 [Vibrio lentus]|nr:hypothetical protein [Vibrio lentus]
MRSVSIAQAPPVMSSRCLGERAGAATIVERRLPSGHIIRQLVAFYRTVHIRGRWHVAVAVFLRSFQSRLFATGVVAARHGIGGDGGLAQLTPVWRCRSRCM